MKIDYLVVGSGLTGAVIARSLVDAGRDVLVIDRRSHVGGNVHDHAHESGIRIHTYGPHYFRTSSERIWDWVNRFARFRHYEAALLTRIGSEHIQWPIPQSYIIRTVGAAWKPSFCNKPQNFEEAALSIMPEPIYRLFVKEYTEKQWGVPCKTLCASLCKRFDVRIDDEPRLTPTCKYQGIPSSGYADWMRSILDGIPIMLNFDYLREPEMITVNRCTVYTGPIDEYFGFSLGRLAYRGQHREHSYIADCRYTQPCGQVNNPTHAGGPHIRTLEWKHMMDPVFANQVTGTVLTRETPFSPTSPGEYEYPFPDDRNAALYANYRRRADSLDSVVIAGRLGEYRYYDMDQAIGRALNLASQLLDR